MVFREIDKGTVVTCDDISYTTKSEYMKINNDPDFRSILKTLGPLGQSDIKRTEEDFLMQRLIQSNGSQITSIESFNYWLLNRLPNKIITSPMVFGSKEFKQQLKFSNVRIVKPCTNKQGLDKRPAWKNITPAIARNQNYSYMCKIISTVTLFINDKQQWNIDDFTIGEVPCMLGCVACHLDELTDGQIYSLSEFPIDTWGYFIIKGGEKVIRIKEHIRYNMFNTFKFSAADPFITRITNNNVYMSGTTVLQMRLNDKTNILEVQLQHFKLQKPYINIFHIFRLLDLSIDESISIIMDFVGSEYKNVIHDMLSQTIFDAYGLDAGDIVEYLKTLREKKYTNNSDEDVRTDAIMDTFSNTKDIDSKVNMLSIMSVRTLMFAKGLVAEDYRDAWGNKKLQLPADQLNNVFNCAWSRITRKFSEEFDSDSKSGNEITESKLSVMFDDEVKKKMIEYFSTNSRSSFGKGGDDSPPTEMFKRMTPLEGTSVTTKTSVPTSKQNKNPEIRVVQPTQVGYICPAETPDGESIGINKHMSVLCRVSIGKEVCTDGFKFDSGDFILIINGIYHSRVDENAYEVLRIMKRDGRLPFDTCIYNNNLHRTIEVYTEDTRPTRPLLVVKNNKLVIDDKQLWHENLDNLIKEGCIEYIDAKEQEYIMLAENIYDVRERKTLVDRGNKEALERMPFTHSEISGNAIFSFSSSIIPWANKNKAPRVVYQAGMSKQATNEYHSAFHTRFDTSFKRLIYPQRPICASNTFEVLGLDVAPNGHNVMVALMVNPNNNEDAIVMKKEMLEGEYFRIGKYSSHRVTVQSLRSLEKFAKQPAKNEYAAARLSKIGDNGFPILGKKIEKGDVIVGKLRSSGTGNIVFNDATGRYEMSNGDEVSNISKIASGDDEGFVNRVLITNTAEGVNATHKTCRVLLYKIRRSQEGDKFACRYSQKGTCGKVESRVNMPIVSGGPNDGVTPDIIVSPCSVPSRMTMSMLIEQIASKAALYTGEKVNATTFIKDDIMEPSRILRKVGEDYGYKGSDLDNFANGKEYMIRPNGKPFRGDGWISLGVICYQALRHHVMDKHQARATGIRSALTRQSLGGINLPKSFKIICLTIVRWSRLS